MPLFSKMGRKQAFLCWGRGGEKPLALLLGPCVLIAICPLHQDAIARVDAVNVAHAERARRPHGYTPSVDTCRLEWRWHRRSHHVSGLEAPHLLLTHLVASRKAFFCPVGATMLASARCLDPQRLQLPQRDTCDLSHTQRVVGVRFLDAEARSVPARSSSRPGAHGQPSAAQGLDQRKAGDIDRGCILERSPGGDLHLGMAEFASRLVAFDRVAAMTSQRQVADAIGSAPRAGSDVINLEGHLRLATVRTPILVFVQQVGAYLPSGKLPVLVLNARDLRVVKELGVEADPLEPRCG